MSFRTLSNLLDDFLFTPRSTAPVALYRIAIGLLALGSGVSLAPDMLLWFGKNGVLSLETARALGQKPCLNLLALLPAADHWVLLFYAVFMGAALMLTLGLLTRVSAAIVWLGLLSFYHRNPLVTHIGDPLLHIPVFFLIFSNAGNSFSLDRRIRVARGTEPPGTPLLGAPWAQRLIQIHMSAVYLSDFLVKWTGAMWTKGSALYYMSRIENFWQFPPWTQGVFEHLWAVQVLTWASMILTFLLSLPVWIIEFRYAILLAGSAFHLLFEYWVNLPLFQPVMLASFLVFIEPDDLERLGQKFRSLRAGGCQTAAPGEPAKNKPLEDKNTRRGPWKTALNLFILWHLLVLSLWNLPPSPMRDKLIRGKIAQYMHLTGLRQWWAMFYSGGAQINWHLEAEITYRDGGRRIWVLPRMDELSISDRLLKILHGTWKAYLPQHKEAWPDTSRYIARLHNDDPGNPPKKIVLVQWWNQIPRPTVVTQPIRWQKTHPVRKELYTYTVKKGEL